MAPLSTMVASIYSITCYAFQPPLLGYKHQQFHLTRSQSKLFSSPTTEEDSTFFLQASRQAAKDRYEKLKNGEDIFGLFRGPLDVSNDEKSSPSQESTVKSESAADPSTASPSDKDETDFQSTILPPPQEESDPFATQTAQYKFHKGLMEARFVMEAKKAASIVSDSNVATQVKESAVLDEIKDISSPPPITAVEKETSGPGCIHKVEVESGEKVTYRNKDQLRTALYPEDTIVQGSNEEAESETIDATETVNVDSAPDEAELLPVAESNVQSAGAEKSVNEENVAMGLLVLTRSFLTLKQIVDSKTN